MTIINKEAMAERARDLYTVPHEISRVQFDLVSASYPELGAYYSLVDDMYMLNPSIHPISPEQQYAILRYLERYNGIRMVLVRIDGDTAHLDAYFYNRNYFEEIISACTSTETARRLFPISGGHRVLAGGATGQVHVTGVTEPDPPDPDQAILVLTVSSVGDYSTYALSIDTRDHGGIHFDPVFSEIEFKFRPRCFSIDCAPEWEPAPSPKANPVIDYMAKDFDSFRHTMISAMMKRVPGWQPTSEADLDQVLLEVFSGAADELSDYQDRVMNEAYLLTARKRVSLARHARLMDYHIHQGNQASTWLVLRFQGVEILEIPKPSSVAGEDPTPLTVWAGSEDMEDSAAIIFTSTVQKRMNVLFNQLGLYTWDGAVPALAAGSTSADIFPIAADGTQRLDDVTAHTVEELIRSGVITHLLIQERLNPGTGREAGRNRKKRQLLRLLPGERGATIREDPVHDAYFVRVQWEEQDALKSNYCFTVDCPEGRQENVSSFYGNVLKLVQGRSVNVVFKGPDKPLLAENEFHYQPTENSGTICRLPIGPLAYQETVLGGETPPKSTLNIEVVDSEYPSWEEVISLVHSDNDVETGSHFMVETDEDGKSLVRFGNGINGRALPKEAEIHCSYQVGYGPDGNIGLDKLRYFDRLRFSEITECWNPFDVTNGKAPEPVAEIIRRAPEAYRHRQLRAITLQDYVHRAEELQFVSKAAAHYAWTGSWRTVQLAIDPVGTTTFTSEFRHEIARHLNALGLIGEDLEIRPPRFVPLELILSLCIHPDYWIEDIRFLVQQELSEGYTADGRMGFFHPDRWTFGQKLRASEVTGRIQRIEGVDHVISVTMKRWDSPISASSEIVDTAHNEIIRVRNDPDHMEEGFTFLNIDGGRE